METTAQAFSVQISGTTCLIATQQLAGNGLYVYHPAYSFSLPSYVEELQSFQSIMQKLISFQQHVITIANVLGKSTPENILTVKNFAIEFGLTDRHYTMTRYRNILSAHFSKERREKFLQDLDGWKKSLEVKIFWKEQARKQTIVETRVRCSAVVDAIINEEGPQG